MCVCYVHICVFAYSSVCTCVDGGVEADVLWKCWKVFNSIFQAYYRLGVAQLGLGQFEDAIVAFAEGLAADPKQAPMLNGLTETMLKSPFRGKRSHDWSQQVM